MTSVAAPTTRVIVYVEGNGLCAIPFKSMSWHEWTSFKEHKVGTKGWENWKEVDTCIVDDVQTGRITILKYFQTAPHS